MSINKSSTSQSSKKIPRIEEECEIGTRVPFQSEFFRIYTVLDKKHRSDSIQGTDYIVTPIQGFLGQKLKI